MIKKIMFFLASFFWLKCFYAQKEANNWYFGYEAGISFNSGAPIALTNGKLTSSEGSAVMSDTQGNLLFYTDGATVWNANHDTLANGKDLWGHCSSTQSSLIVPLPENDSIYYLFTVDANIGQGLGIPCGGGGASGYGGLAYSIIDLSKNEGLGEVITKNIPMLTPTTEKLTAVKHCNGRDIWVITHQWNSNAFYAYLISYTGIIDTVISKSGSNHTGLITAGSVGAAYGQLKASPDGTKIAAALYDQGVTQLFDFDNTTGIISSPITFLDANYGVSFSPNGHLLYISSAFYIYQYDVSLCDSNSIKASEYTIPAGGQALQLAPNGKIYTPRLTVLGVINNPNVKGAACNYSPNGVTLAGRQSALGLPNFMESFFNDNSLVDFSFTIDSCSLSFTPSTLACHQTVTYLWDFGDPVSGSSNISSLSNPSHLYTSNGQYAVKLKVSGNCFSDSVIKTISIDTCKAPAPELIPNIFSPNDDGTNDLFTITKGDRITTVQCTIYNRWGNKVGGWNTLSGNWDGRTTNGEPAPAGVYYYVYEATDVNDAVINESDFVQLIR